jgi:hypothetical protein
VGRIFCALLCLAMAMAASGCATVVKGTEDSISIQTEPEGALCKLEREGGTIAVVDPTPGTVEVDRDSADIVVTCDLAGYETTTERMVASASGATHGNIILGGLVGMMVDAASGADYEYPDSIAIAMIPAAFISEAQRDQIYDRLTADVQARYEKKTQDKKDQCPEIAKLDRIRLQEAVQPPGTAAGQTGKPDVSAQAAEQAERAYWVTIEDSNDPEAYRNYIAAYPNGRFRDAARQRLNPAAAPGDLDGQVGTLGPANLKIDKNGYWVGKIVIASSGPSEKCKISVALKDLKFKEYFRCARNS